MKIIESLIAAIVLSAAILFCSTDGVNFSQHHESIIEDGNLNLSELVTKYGYPITTHQTQTSDGYILTLYRIPHSSRCQNFKLKKPVLLQHGLLCSAFDYLILGPKKSLGYLLADSCYDVWLGNNRGNSESREHINMTTEEKDYWQFTWHEMGKYDIPAMVDYILNFTGQSSLHYIGHSQGTTQFFVFGALHPEYHSKIKTMQALSPVVFMKNLGNPFIKALSIFHKPTEIIADLVGLYEFLPQSQFLNLLGKEICQDSFPSLQGLCANALFLLCGFDEPQLNKTILPAVLGHVPAGAATKQMVHYAQSISSGQFKHFDYGILKNLEVYKSVFPPEYDLTQINIPIALYYGMNDWLSAVKDVKFLEKKLPNVIASYQVPYSKFNHLDFLFATDVKFLLYDKVLEVMEKYQ